MGESGDINDENAPWLQTPSRRPKIQPITESLPDRINAVMAQRLFVEKRGLPSALLNQIKRLAAFQNPEFFKKQNMRLSTATTPRVVACAEDLPEHMALPRGCLEDLQTLLDPHSVKICIDDQRNEGAQLDGVTFGGQLTTAQQDAVTKILAHDLGVFVAPPGVGKTVVGTFLVAERKCNTLVLVHRRPLMDQWRAQLSMFLGLDAKEIGQIGGGKRKITGQIDVAMIQSLARKGHVDDLIAEYGYVIVDECHHIPAVSFERILAEARQRRGTSQASPQRQNDAMGTTLSFKCR
jgi:hypothetical protein